MIINQTILANLDQLLIDVPEKEIPILVGELLKHLMAKQATRSASLQLRDRDDHPVGHFDPQEINWGYECQTETQFIELAKRRIAKPPERFMSVEEFIQALDAD